MRRDKTGRSSRGRRGKEETREIKLGGGGGTIESDSHSERVAREIRRQRETEESREMN